MHKSTTTSSQRWKSLFLILETFVLFGCLYGMALRMIGTYAMGEHPYFLAAYRVLSPWLMPMVWSFLAASFFLQLSSPFLLKSLRSVALQAWIAGVAAFLCFLWLWLM